MQCALMDPAADWWTVNPVRLTAINHTQSRLHQVASDVGGCSWCRHGMTWMSYRAPTSQVHGNRTSPQEISSQMQPRTTV